MTIERVSFEVAGDAVVGDLHSPAGSGPHPALIVAGPMTSVKEQVTGVYAAALAERGFIALALDHRGYGESGGAPRQYEHHGRKVEDLRSALDHLAARPDVDDGRLGAAAVCLGAGYAVWTAVEDARVKAVGAVAGYYRHPEAMRAADLEGYAAKVAQGAAARRRFEATGEIEIIPAVALEGDAAMQTADTFDYYARRATGPNYVNGFAVMSREVFLPFDVQAAAPQLNVPFAMVHAEKALSPAWARRFYDSVPGEKSALWLESPGQTAFYDDPGLVAAAADRLAEHFHAHLGRG